MADAADIAGDWIDAELEDRLARRVRYAGESATECDECGEVIPSARREAIPGTRHCVDCATVMERR